MLVGMALGVVFEHFEWSSPLVGALLRGPGIAFQSPTASWADWTVALAILVPMAGVHTSKHPVVELLARMSVGLWLVVLTSILATAIVG